MPAFTGPTSRSEIPSLKGVLVSSLVSYDLLSDYQCEASRQVPGSLRFPGCSLREQLYHTIMCLESQDQRKFQNNLAGEYRAITRRNIG